MNIVIEDRGNHKVYTKVAKTPKILRKAVYNAFSVFGRDLIAEANRQILHTPKSGKVYYRRGRRRRASAPGESHADATGELRRSLSFKINGTDLDFGYGLGFLPAPPQANIEEGFGRVAPRPTLRHTVNKTTKKFTIRLLDSLNQVFK